MKCLVLLLLALPAMGQFGSNATLLRGQHLCNPLGPTDGQVLSWSAANECWGPATGASGGGTVTSVGFTGGLLSIANPTTTPAVTVAGASGGIPYFSSGSSWLASALLPQYGVVYGGGAGGSPVGMSPCAANTFVAGMGAGTAPGCSPTFGPNTAQSCAGGTVTEYLNNNLEAIALGNALTCAVTLGSTGFAIVGQALAIVFTQGSTTPTTTITFAGGTVHGAVVAAGTVNQVATMNCVVTSITGPVLACVSSGWGN